MGILDFFRGKTQINLSDMELTIDTQHRAYLKRLALDTCINFVARTISDSEFRVMDGKKHSAETTLNYKLNVRPNTDKSAANFWQDLVYTLIYDNEVLVIKTDTDDLVIADSFVRKSYALYDDVFEDVTIGDYTYERTFPMSEVLHLTYNNEQLSTFIEGLYKDYGKLFGQMMDSNLRHNQFRGVFRFKDGGNLSPKQIQQQREQVNRLTEIFKENSVAFAPLTEGIELENLSANTATKDESINDLVKLKRDLVDDISKMLGIPTNLIHGDVADLEKTMEAYISFCVKPLINKITDELNAKFFTKSEYQNGKHVKVIGLNRRDPIKHAQAMDKLIASSAFTRNEVREMFDFAPVENGDDFLITKNYQELTLIENSSRGGESE